MKKIYLILLVFFLIACGEKNPNTSRVNAPRLEAFEVSDKCPRVCWLGIRPGVTPIEDAVAVLAKSDEIDHEKFYTRTDSGIATIWNTDKMNVYAASVWLNFDNGVVESINFGTLAPFTIIHFITLIGEPDQIVIRLDKTIDGGDIVQYATYFPTYRASLYVYPGSWNGPNPEDFVNSLVLNSEFVYPKSFEEIKPQPWLGYGQLRDYLPGQKIPFPPISEP